MSCITGPEPVKSYLQVKQWQIVQGHDFEGNNFVVVVYRILYIIIAFFHLESSFEGRKIPSRIE